MFRRALLGAAIVLIVAFPKVGVAQLQWPQLPGGGITYRQYIEHEHCLAAMALFAEISENLSSIPSYEVLLALCGSPNTMVIDLTELLSGNRE
jgi:hypothetical protein